MQRRQNLRQGYPPPLGRFGHRPGVGLEVRLSPELWDRSPRATLAYLEKAAAAAEKIRMERRGELVFLVGSESTLFMRGIVPGRSVAEPMRRSWTLLKEGRHNAPLNAFLAEANAVARGAFHGRVSYASLVWEAVDWKLFDAVGVDHYWNERIADRYLELLAPVFAFGKPVVITEFGFRTYREPRSRRRAWRATSPTTGRASG